MGFFDDVRRIKPLDPFAGGSDKARGHLNDIVDAINDIIQAANVNQPGNAPQQPTLIVTLLANGATTDAVITAYIPQPPPP